MIICHVLTILQNCLQNCETESTQVKRSLTNKNISKIANDLYVINWSDFIGKNNHSVDRIMETVHCEISKCIDKHAPERLTNVSTNQTIYEVWMSKSLH